MRGHQPDPTLEVLAKGGVGDTLAEGSEPEVPADGSVMEPLAQGGVTEWNGFEPGTTRRGLLQLGACLGGAFPVEFVVVLIRGGGVFPLTCGEKRTLRRGVPSLFKLCVKAIGQRTILVAL
jgi:hypothetical protein